MRKLLPLILVCVAGSCFAQTAQDKSLQGQPIEISSTGGTTYDNGVASAKGNVSTLR